MKMSVKLFVFVVTLTIISSLRAQPTTTPDNHVTLFNGKDLTGWRIFLEDKSVDASKIWSVEDGVLKLTTHARGYVVTEKPYSNYHLHVEWRWPINAPASSNSGVFVHINGPDEIWPKCFECQLQADNAGQIVGTGLDIPDAPMQSNRKRAPKLARASEKPFGQWNSYDIHARKNTLELFVNGVKQNYVDKLPVSEGAIGLQLEGSPIDFRNIWLEAE